MQTIQVRPSRNPRWQKQGSWEVLEREMACKLRCSNGSGFLCGVNHRSFLVGPYFISHRFQQPLRHSSRRFSESISLPSTNRSVTTRFTMAILLTILVGLIVGAIAKLLMPGKDPGGFIVTILLGIAGALIAITSARPSAGTRRDNQRAGSCRSSAP